MTDESKQDHCATRRCVLLGAGVLGAAGILTACSTAAVPYDANDAGQAPATAGPPTTATMAPSASGGGVSSGAKSSGTASSGPVTGSASAAPMGTALGLAADIPVGGGKVYQAAQVVVTQPAKGQFKAFSAICTHVGCLCNQVAAGTINCPCHGSKFKITDGSVVTGPAMTPLATASITVAGGKIYLQ